MQQENPLPDGWKWLTISKVADINGRDASIRNLSDDLTVTFVPMSAVDGEKGIIAKPESRTLKEVRKGYTPFSNGDVIFAKITPCMENGKAAIANGLKNGLGFGSTEFHVLQPRELVTAKWIYHFIRQEKFRQDAKASFTGTAGQLRVSKNFLIEYPIPIPPLSEQERIVAKIEELFTQLEAGTAALRRIQAGLKRYKASVLKAACEGRLVAQDPSDEPAEVLLREIGKTPLSSEDLSPLPQGWCWVKWEHLVSISQNGFGKRKSEIGIPTIVLRLADIVGNKISYKNVRKIRTTEEEIRKFQLAANDLICIRVNGSLENVGRMVIFQNFPEQITFCDHFIRFRLIEPEISLFYSMYFNSDRARKFIEQNRVSSAGQNTISQGVLSNFVVPLPPRAEQQRILTEVEQRLSIIQELEQVVSANLKRAVRLRQSILKRAFAGRLVEQNPGDEPVEVLL